MSQTNVPGSPEPGPEPQDTAAALCVALGLPVADVSDDEVPPADFELLEAYVRAVPPLAPEVQGMVLWLVTRNVSWKKALAAVVRRIAPPPLEINGV